MLSNALTLLHSMQHYIGEHLEEEQLRQMVKEDEEEASESLGGYPLRTQSSCWSCGEFYGRGSPPISCGKCGAIQVRGCVCISLYVCVCGVCISLWCVFALHLGWQVCNITPSLISSYHPSIFRLPHSMSFHVMYVVTHCKPDGIFDAYSHWRLSCPCAAGSHRRKHLRAVWNYAAL